MDNADSRYDIVPLYRLERTAIEHALVKTGGQKTLAADLLGIGRTTIYRKLREYARKDRVIAALNQPRVSRDQCPTR